jgi:hypothetical protein
MLKNCNIKKAVSYICIASLLGTSFVGSNCSVYADYLDDARVTIARARDAGLDVASEFKKNIEQGIKEGEKFKDVIGNIYKIIPTTKLGIRQQFYNAALEVAGERIEKLESELARKQEQEDRICGDLGNMCSRCGSIIDAYLLTLSQNI